MVAELHGIIPPMVTPFTEDGDIDEEGLRSEVQVLLSSGIDGLTVCGSTGEGHTLTAEETFEISRIVVDEVDGHVPVVTGIIQNSTRGAIRYAKPLRDLGITALQITPVHYLFSPGDEGQSDFYREIGQAVDIPIIVYNVIPWNTLSPQLLIRLAEIPEVIGVKQSGGDIHALADLIQRNNRELKIFTAIDDLLYPSFCLGADGAISAILTVLPDLGVRLWEAAGNGNHKTARDIHEHILPVWRALNHPDMISRVKAAIELRGRRVGKPRHPSQPVSAAVRAEIDGALGRAGVL